jgi:hypothetical protein
MMPDEDAGLRALYARLLEQRAVPPNAPSVPVETIHALAAGTYAGKDREALLDAVLADPATRAEFRFFRDVVREGPRAGGFRVARWAGPLALAASVAIVVTLGSRLVDRGPGPLRGEDPAMSVVSPGASVAAGDVRFTWRPVQGVETYDLEVTRDDGASILRATTTDTTVLATLPASPDTLRWWLTVRHDDGRVERSPIRTLLVRAR